MKQSYLEHALQQVSEFGIDKFIKLSENSETDQKRIIAPLLKPVINEVITLAVGGEQNISTIMLARIMHPHAEIMDVVLTAEMEEVSVVQKLQQKGMYYESLSDVYVAITEAKGEHVTSMMKAVTNSVSNYVEEKTAASKFSDAVAEPITLRWLSQPHKTSLIHVLMKSFEEKRISNTSFTNLCHALWLIRSAASEHHSLIPCIASLLIADRSTMVQGGAQFSESFANTFKIDETKESIKTFIQRLVRANPSLADLATKSLDLLEV
jgi:hypothetical protein